MRSPRTSFCDVAQKFCEKFYQCSSAFNATGILTAQNQPQGNITIQRATQITLPAALPIATQSATYHVPRGPAVVASLNAPPRNVLTTIRAPTQGTVQVNLLTNQ